MTADIRTQAQFDELIASGKPINSGYLILCDVAINENRKVIIRRGGWIAVGDDCALSVCNGGCLQINDGANVSINNSATLSINNGGAIVSGGSLTIRYGGTLGLENGGSLNFLSGADMKGTGEFKDGGGKMRYEGIETTTDFAANLRIVARAALAKPDSLIMAIVHNFCDTAHCIAGWACVLLPGGAEAEAAYGWKIAGLKLLGAEAALHFNDCDEDAREFLQAHLN